MSESDKINEFGQKKAYSFDKETGEFVGVVWADPDQMKAGHYLLPANATFTPLDEKKEGHAIVYKEGKKTFVIDQRGQAYWDKEGNQHTITQLGQTTPKDALLKEPEVALTQDELAEQVRAERNSLLTRVSHEIERRLDADEEVTAWRQYRQFLRAVPEQAGFPNKVDWGKIPAEFTGK